MSEFSIFSEDFKEGGEIPKKCGYKHGNEIPHLEFNGIPDGTNSLALVMDDPDAMAAVGKIWVHWLAASYDLENADNPRAWLIGQNDFGETDYGGPAPPDKRHTYIFKVYALDTRLDLKEGYSKQELEDVMKGHIVAEANLTGTYAP